MIYYAYIVKWHKNDPESPGNLKSSQLLEQLAGENIIPEKFEVDIDSMIDYLSLLMEIEQFTTGFSGLLSVKLNNDLSIFLFDTLENLNLYNSSRKELPNWSAYETARDNFLSKIGVSFEIQPTREIVANESLTPSDVIQNITE
jgi:hypothetical protein